MKIKNIPNKIIGLLAIAALALTIIYIVVPFFEKNGDQVVNELKNQEEKLVSLENNEQPVLSEKFSFVIMGDSNGGGGTIQQPTVFKNIVQEILATPTKTDFVVHAGDMIAGTSSTSKSWSLQMWEGFMTTIDPWLKAEIGFFPSAGNHDASFGWALPQAYQEYWGKYKNAGDYKIRGSYAGYYSFAYQGSYFIVMYGSKINIEQEQLDWLKSEVDKAQGQYDNIFVFSHIPLTAASTYHPTDQLTPNLEIKSILRGKITAFFGGHHNVYYDKTLDGIRQIGVGRAGSGGAYFLKPAFGSGYQNYYSYLRVNVEGEDLQVEQVVVK